MATLDELVVRIKADATQLHRELKRTTSLTQQSTNAMGSSFTGFGRTAGVAIAAVATALIAFTSKSVTAADALNDLSARTGVSAEYLSQMRTEIENNGGSVEQFAQSLFMMNRQLGEALGGNDAVIESFKKLKLNIDDLADNSPEDNFRLIADAISKLPTEFERAEAAAALLGRGVAGIQPIIREGAAGIDAITAKADEFGQSLSKEQLQAIDDFGDGMNTLGNIMENLAAGAFADVVISVQSIISAVSDGIEKIKLLSEGGLDALDYIDKAREGGFATTIQRGPVAQPAVKGTRSATRSDKDVKAAEMEAKKALQERLAIIEKNRTAYEVMIDDSRKANELLAGDQEQLNRELQRSWTEYVTTIDEQNEKAKDSTEDLAVSIRKSLANSFEDALFDAENFGDALTSLLDGIARQIARTAFIDPLSKGIGDAIADDDFISGIGDFFTGLGFADGGRPPVGRASIVGENGPEWFVPDSAGTVIPNGAGGGGGVSVSNTWNIQSGVTRQELAALIPVIEARSTAATLAAVERGGRASQIVGKRN